MVNKKELLKSVEWETEYYKPHTRSQYFKHLNDYLDWVKTADWKDKTVLKRYTQVLAKLGLTQQHINYIIRGPIGALFRSQGLRIPIKLPHVEDAIVSNPKGLTWQDDQIEALVMTARMCDIQVQAVMALATVYAPRLSEIIKVREEDIDKNKGIITIHTVKHGLVRRHLIPDILKTIFYDYNWEHLSEMQLREMLDVLVHRAGIKRTRRLSYHGFRHALLTDLDYLGFSENERYKFTGHREGGTHGKYIEPLKMNVENDQKIFEKHPFLKYWE